MSLFRVYSSIAGTATSSSSLCYRNAVVASAALHTSAVRSAESQKQRVARIVRKTNIEKKAERARFYEQNKPHVILGTRPGQEEKWRNCDLARILITPEDLASSPPVPLSGTDPKDTKIVEPKFTGYGLDGLDGSESRKEQLDFFFGHLPIASGTAGVKRDNADSTNRVAASHGSEGGLSKNEKADFELRQLIEADKARQLARVVDLRNANARGIAFENRRRVIAAFSPTGNATDSGYPEVQVALLTMKIRNVWSHLMQRKKDIHSRRALRLLVHQRAKMLKYVKHLDRDRYDRVLERTGIESGAVEGELVV